MIYEYTLAPTVLSKWAECSRDYNEFLREYGIGTPRIISCFPKKKASKLRSYLLNNNLCDEHTLKGRRYLEMVDKLIESLVVRDIGEIQREKWEENVKLENENFPFDVIISSDNIDIPRNITISNMHDRDSIWNHPYQVNITRTNEGLYRAIFNLLRLSSKIVVFIDAYGWKANSIVFIKYILNQASRNRVHSQLPTFKLYYKQHNQSPSALHVKSEIVREINHAEINITLDVYELEEIPGNDVFHNRCIMTEHGGVSTGHGISISGDERHTDEATLMNLDIYQKKWNQFIDEKCFKTISKA